VIISTGGHPAGLAFDTAGFLWVANTSLNQVSGYSPLQLNTSGLLVPAQVVINANGISLKNPTGIAFDATGNLWVANLSTSKVVSFSPTQLTETGSPVPKVVLSSAGGSLNGPSGLAFDVDGSLWVMGSQGDLYKFPIIALGATSAPSPSVSLHLSNYTVLWDLAFWPKPAGLPLN
jgi:sugar lactone lactonase YvrE